MSDTALPPPAPASRLARLRAWVSTHKPVAVGGAAAAGVAGFAIYRRRAATPGSGANSATGGAGATPGNAPIAGLSGDPADYTSEIENWVQDALNTNNANLLAELATAPKPVHHRRPVPAAPRPGAGTYRIRKGDTLAKIAAYTLGDDSAANIRAIRRANPILISFPRTARLDWLAGDLIHIPKAPPRAKRPAPKKRRRRPGSGTGAVLPPQPQYPLSASR
jgi:hypothetical protein